MLTKAQAWIADVDEIQVRTLFHTFLLVCSHKNKRQFDFLTPLDLVRKEVARWGRPKGNVVVRITVKEETFV